MRTRALHWAGVLSLGFVVGCGGEGTGPSDNITGTYVLASIAGRSMPTWSINQPGVRLDILNAEFTLRADGSAVVSTESRATGPGYSTTSTSAGAGTYSVDGGTLRMNMSGSANGQSWQKTSVGTLEGSAVLFPEEGQGVFRYQRR